MDSMNNYENQSPADNGQGTPKKTNGFAIAGMVLGIVSIPASCCIAGIGILIGILGLVFSIIAQSKEKSKMGLAGIICAIVGLVFGIANFALGAWMGATGFYDDFYRSLGIY